MRPNRLSLDQKETLKNGLFLHVTSQNLCMKLQTEPRLHPRASEHEAVITLFSLIILISKKMTQTSHHLPDQTSTCTLALIQHLKDNILCFFCTVEIDDYIHL